MVIKARLVVLKQAGSGAVSTHLRFIARDGVSPDGQRAHAYGALTDAADLKEFEARGHEDQHQFRFIVAPEDATELGDLREFTRDLLLRMEADLETLLE